MFGLELFEGMYEEDQDASKLHQMPGVEAMLTRYPTHIVDTYVIKLRVFFLDLSIGALFVSSLSSSAMTWPKWD